MKTHVFGDFEENLTISRDFKSFCQLPFSRSLNINKNPNLKNEKYLKK